MYHNDWVGSQLILFVHFVLLDLTGCHRRALHDIFEPLIKDIDKLVGEQVDKVCIKRMRERHPKGFDIKVAFSTESYHAECYADGFIGDISCWRLWF